MGVLSPSRLLVCAVCGLGEDIGGVTGGGEGGEDSAQTQTRFAFEAYGAVGEVERDIAQTGEGRECGLYGTPVVIGA
jgi:hypothetical protein